MALTSKKKTEQILKVAMTWSQQYWLILQGQKIWENKCGQPEANGSGQIAV